MNKSRILGFSVYVWVYPHFNGAKDHFFLVLASFSAFSGIVVCLPHNAIFAAETCLRPRICLRKNAGTPYTLVSCSFFPKSTPGKEL